MPVASIGRERSGKTKVEIESGFRFQGLVQKPDTSIVTLMQSKASKFLLQYDATFPDGPVMLILIVSTLHAEEFLKITLLIALAAVGDLLGADVAHTILLNPKGFITVSSTTSICVPPASSSLIFLVSILFWRACKSESLFAGKRFPRKNQFF